MKAVDAIQDLFQRGAIVGSKYLTVSQLDDGRLSIEANIPATPSAPNDCDECDGVKVWEATGPSHTGTPYVCDNADVVLTLPLCAYSWTYHFEPHTSADLFQVNDVTYSGCTPLFGSPLPNADGTVLVTASGRTLHITVQCSCSSPPDRNSSWYGYIICNVAS